MIEKELYDQISSYYSLKSRIRFEIISFIGRHFLKRRSLIIPKTDPVYVDIGVGTNYSEGNNWIDIDFFHFRNPLKIIRNKDRISHNIETDIRYPLKCASNSIDGVFSCHVIEHLLVKDAINLLAEIFRVLKPGGYVRLVVPDIQLYINFYNGLHNSLSYDTGCEAIMGYTQNWGHLSTWDEEFLSLTLKKLGFSSIRNVKYGKEGAILELIKEPDEHKFQSIVVEAKKPE